jgi:hypothetical protein
MSQRTMSKVFQAILDDAVKGNELYSLLEDLGRENERPIIQIGNKDFRLGLVDGQPMLADVVTKEFISPVLVINQVVGVKWLLQPNQMRTQSDTNVKANIGQATSTRDKAKMEEQRQKA